MSRMGSGRRADIIRRRLDQSGNDKERSFAVSCRLVRNAVITAVPGQASDRDRAEWRSVVETVLTVALSCQSLQELEEKISAQSAALRRPPENAVVLSTIHSAKGLEWEAVLMIGMEDGVLPHRNNDDLEEERRVAYVGISRARRILGLTYANVRFGQSSSPSPFLHELAGRERRFCIWTGPQAQGADERMPLLSDRERRRLDDDLSSQRVPAPSRARADGTGLSADGQGRRSRKKNEALPARHGHSWSADEDDRLRTMFLDGEAIAAIASTHARKRGAIRSRLVKLGLIVESVPPQSD
jgi:DNA helicase-2/ATP-dependent DNA helicase PcrA